MDRHILKVREREEHMHEKTFTDLIKAVKRVGLGQDMWWREGTMGDGEGH